MFYILARVSKSSLLRISMLKCFVCKPKRTFTKYYNNVLNSSKRKKTFLFSMIFFSLYYIYLSMYSIIAYIVIYNYPIENKEVLLLCQILPLYVLLVFKYQLGTIWTNYSKVK